MCDVGQSNITLVSAQFALRRNMSELEASKNDGLTPAPQPYPRLKLVQIYASADMRGVWI